MLRLPEVLAATLDAARAAPLFWAAPFLRPWHLRWGATDDEVAGPMPGDDLLPRAPFVATRAIDIATPPEDVWPWIVQIGFRRAGFYSYDLFDNLAQPSAERIVPELQTIAIGDRIVMAELASDATAFRVAGFQPTDWLLWHKPDSTWAWRLTRTPAGGTRLVTRLKASYDFDRPGSALVSIALMEFADFPMMRRLLLGLRDRAEGRLPARPDVSVTPPALSHWAGDAAFAAYRAAYLHALEAWPLPYETRHVPTSSGSTHVVISGAPDGEPLVLLHAASLSATQWTAQAADLGARHRLYAIDLMADIGLSAQTAPIRTRADGAAWLRDVLDGLGLDRAVLIGSSFGGFHATNLAVNDPERVAGLILLAPAATVRPFRALANAVIRLGSLWPLPATVRPGLRGMMGGALPDERIVQQMEAGVAGFRYDHDSLFPSEIPDDELARLACPTLLLIGDQEMIYDPRAALDRARRLIPKVDAGLVPGVGHLLGLQEPDVVDARILAFLATRVWPEPRVAAALR